ncbi:Costars domain-containing protein [Meloidogyne graminicola]|uniref:Costars domain-containing protein n=1 Tax=Meloidogyne graminicola TaxID=189291 RepID=A0A8S9ZVT5_9BILA|nr:Costars domain-containing protein [Meloidogyne graminicola]
MPAIRPPTEKSVCKTIERFNKEAQKSEQETKLEFGSKGFVGNQKFDKKSSDYGRPIVGTKSQARGVRAGSSIMQEVIFLCEIIEKNANGIPPNCSIKFGQLFYIYNNYSQSLVGMLIRARKYGLVDFEGEMLYQRQDDNKEVKLLKSVIQIKESIEYSGDPVNCIKIKDL